MSLTANAAGVVQPTTLPLCVELDSTLIASNLLMIQKKIHRGVFSVGDGTFAGDGSGPRCMIPHVNNVILASSDLVVIDAVAARLMGFDPLSIRYIRLAHEAGLGCGDPRATRSSATPKQRPRRGVSSVHFTR